ncbi:hypothetical protein DASC09_025220 [Saccharomycopsis crataegensis]|uniref:Uncharacterized protein n=1 Tax=Saccharomycopsis crataegensis TaxID=43959 RepID=A0AAV5QKX1_9ASCO|nr:hypothetical protein DASC09_025220 [Saccharomycopsis crataegensis]
MNSEVKRATNVCDSTRSTKINTNNETGNTNNVQINQWKTIFMGKIQSNEHGRQDDEISIFCIASPAHTNQPSIKKQ